MGMNFTCKIGDITVGIVHDLERPAPHVVPSPIMDWACDLDEMGRNLRAVGTTAFLAKLNQIAIPLNVPVATQDGRPFELVAETIAGSVRDLAERRRIKYTERTVANPFTIIFVSTDKTTKSGNAVIAALLKANNNPLSQNNNG